MTDPEDEAAFFARRAKEEELLALSIDHPEVANAHHGLAIQYVGRMRSALLLARDDHPTGS